MNTRVVRARSALEGSPIKINAFICIDSTIGALDRSSPCVNARRDEDKYLYWRVKTRGNRNQTSISLRWLRTDPSILPSPIYIFLPFSFLAPLFFYRESRAGFPPVLGQSPYSNVNHCHLRGSLEYQCRSFTVVSCVLFSVDAKQQRYLYSYRRIKAGIAPDSCWSSDSIRLAHDFPIRRCCRAI